LSASYSTFGIKDFQQYISPVKTFMTFSFQMLNLCSLAPRDMIWPCLKGQWDFRCHVPSLHWKYRTWETCWRVHCSKWQHPFTSKEAWWQTWQCSLILHLSCPHFSLAQAFIHTYEGI